MGNIASLARPGQFCAVEAGGLKANASRGMEASEEPGPRWRFRRSSSHRCLLDPEHSRTPVGARFDLKSVIGAGSYANTRLAVERATGRHFAVKCISKQRLSADERRRVRREMQVLYTLQGHPGIVSLEGAYEDKTTVYLVMELCSGGDLRERLLREGPCPEAEAVSIMRALLDAVAYAHELGVMHRDIKVDNLLRKDNAPNARVKLCDWGYASFLSPGVKLHKLCGTCSYVAPEVISGCYGAPADVWSCGVVAFALLSGRLPFEGSSQQEVLDAIAAAPEGPPSAMSGAAWGGVSQAAQDAVAAMLTRDPAARPTARGALALPWLRTSQDGDGEPEVLHRIQSFASMDALKKHAALFIARSLPADAVRGLAALFEAFDRSGRGAITARDLAEALAPHGSSLTEEDLAGLLDVAGLHGQGALDLPEFVAAALHQSWLESEENVEAAFKHFDADGDGVISASDLAAALRAEAAAAGPDAAGAPAPAPSDEEAAAMLAEADEDGDGCLDWKEFKHMMRSIPSPIACHATVSLDRRSSCGFYDLY